LLGPHFSRLELSFGAIYSAILVSPPIISWHGSLCSLNVVPALRHPRLEMWVYGIFEENPVYLVNLVSLDSLNVDNAAYHIISEDYAVLV
jgi:hypothetical protein